MIQATIPTLNAFKDEYIAFVREVKQKRSWKRDKELLDPLCKLFGNRKLSEISVKDLEDFKLIRMKKVKPATVNRSLSVLRHLLNVAKRWKKFFGENPVSIVGMLEENNLIERILTDDEEQKLLSSAISYLKPIIITALHTGMRKSEMLNLRWEDVDLDNNLITVTQTNSKSKKANKVYINPKLKKVMLELRVKSNKLKLKSKELNSKEIEYVFLDDKGNHLREIKNGFDGACSQAKIQGLRFHDLRHTAATRMIEGGASIVAVSKALGHSDIKTTMRYTHLDHSVRDAFEILAQDRTQNRIHEKLENS
ncbi:MAG TPA: site-specific integrase [Thermodesulfobacteriota bacterium]|nr:site-specific integrase [Thermodesulfobacteriota bacterium]